MRLKIEQDLKPVLDLAQKTVVLLEDRPLLVNQAAAVLQLRDRFQGIAGAQGGQVAAVEELEELNHELNVADAPVSGLHVPRIGPVAVRPLLDAALQRADAADVRAAQVAAINPGPQGLEELFAQGPVAGRDAGLDVRLPLPGAPAEVVVMQGAGNADHDGAALAVGPQTEIDPVGRAQFGGFGQQPHHLLRQAFEELHVGDRPLGGVGLAVRVVEEDQIDVAGIVQLDAAQFAQRQDDETGRVSVRTAGVPRFRSSFSHADSSAACRMASARWEICAVTVSRLCSRMMSP